MRFIPIGFATGLLSGGHDWRNRRALAIVSFVRNAPISMATATASQVFPHEPGVPVMVTALRDARAAVPRWCAC